ncbi:hypothetical protein GUJ93_ZPchr0013g35432 [Zizania palustris]|uniref:Uncharacterized protein n=1 Tax=Zizania palustris TaxID=103762 RepID=A0A8J5WU06_ZIZPA|nr:hypothetical protein GUJ93_ZPchr0013g35432 [Zizania palustris]
MPWLEMWLPPVGGGGGEGLAAGLFLDGEAAHGALLAAMPGCSASFRVRRRRREAPPGFLSLTMSVKGGRGFVSGPVGLLAGGEEKGARAEEAEGLVPGRRVTEEKLVETEGKVVEEVQDRTGAGAIT